MHLIDRRTDPPRFVMLRRDDAGRWLVRRGTVGRVAAATAVDSAVAEPYLSDGYQEFPDAARADVVIQWPMRSPGGTAHDRWLLERATEVLDGHLGERGLGYVDGHDRGRRLPPHEGFVQNLFCHTVDGNLGAQAAMSALRAGRLDATRATVAYRLADTDEWTVRYERRAAKLPRPFSL